MSLRQQGPQALVSARRDRMIRQMEARLEKAFAAAVRDLLRHALASVEVVRLTAAVEQSVRVFSVGEATAWWEAALNEHVRSAMMSVWRAGYFDTRDGGLTARSRADMAAFASQSLARLVDGKNGPPQRIYEVARAALDSELAAGRSLNDAVSRLAAELSWNDATSTWQTQSEALARSSTTATYNRGSLVAARDEDASVKVWIATPDAITRDTHLEASGQCTTIQNLFSVGADMLDYPGDESGSPEEVANCRCTLVFASSCAEAEELYGEVYAMIEDEQERREAGDEE